MSSKLEPMIWLRDTGHIGIHGGADGQTEGRTYVRTYVHHVMVFSFESFHFFSTFLELWGDLQKTILREDGDQVEGSMSL